MIFFFQFWIWQAFSSLALHSITNVDDAGLFTPPGENKFRHSSAAVPPLREEAGGKSKMSVTIHCVAVASRRFPSAQPFVDISMGADISYENVLLGCCTGGVRRPNDVSPRAGPDP
ncbi:uncharacterized protein LAESUDRAFT_722379 [Laetiporus sulphureus 93-53]|uniref:Secreted protein n=1 Tax=Laetiporus sulphureus 93-53 TaxID=1314785 RepID=A0A165GDM7_9APHY|nr:uncharacterized protein LAESUDRAFT_722379 [Laetiporus sulphureus 93-53]KZT10202.1 hypothetical protein LAESUDRAFT_722379 [Laetiporus sulphureus 93-53]